MNVQARPVLHVIGVPQTLGQERSEAQNKFASAFPIAAQDQYQGES